MLRWVASARAHVNTTVSYLANGCTVVGKAEMDGLAIFVNSYFVTASKWCGQIAPNFQRCVETCFAHLRMVKNLRGHVRSRCYDVMNVGMSGSM